MNKEIISKLMGTKAFSRIYQKNLKAIKAAKHQAFVEGLVMLFKDAESLEKGDNSNAKESGFNPFSSSSNDTGISKNDYSHSGSWGKSTGGSAKSSFKPASEKQIKYIKFLIYVLSKDYSSSSYGQIYDEICKKNGIKSLTNTSKSKAYHLIQDLKSLLPVKSKPKSGSKVSESLPF